VTARRIPAPSQQAALHSLGPDHIRHLAERYGQAIESGDLETLLSMLTEDASWAMPPLAGWYRGRPAIAAFLRRDVFPERWRHRIAGANGQLAVAGYLFDEDRRCYTAAALDVLTLDGGLIAAVTGFLTVDDVASPDGAGYRFGADVFPRFGLPAELPV
jgi:hypothetical protein